MGRYRANVRETGTNVKTLAGDGKGDAVIADRTVGRYRANVRETRTNAAKTSVKTPEQNGIEERTAVIAMMEHPDLRAASMESGATGRKTAADTALVENDSTAIWSHMHAASRMASHALLTLNAVAGPKEQRAATITGALATRQRPALRSATGDGVSVKIAIGLGVGA
jgi:hypothetical protein